MTDRQVVNASRTIIGSNIATRVLDQHLDAKDDASRAYGLARLVPEPARVGHHYAPGPVLDQGQDGHCGGFGLAAEAAASPVRVRGVDDAYGHAAYYEIKDRRLDNFGREEGTSSLAVAKLGVIRGLWASYWWALNGIEDLDRGFRVGPMCFGLPWFTGCFRPDVDGRIRATGQVEGGHFLVGVGRSMNYRRKGPHTKMQQSWGRDHGRGGFVWVPDEDMHTMLVDHRGEAFAPVQRADPVLRPAA